MVVTLKLPRIVSYESGIPLKDLNNYSVATNTEKRMEEKEVSDVDPASLDGVEESKDLGNNVIIRLTFEGLSV